MSIFSLKYVFSFSKFAHYLHIERHKSSLSRGKKSLCISEDGAPILNVNCKIALITGGSSGIGLAVAHELLTEKAKNVAIIGIDKQKGRDAINILNNHYGKNRAVFFACNVQNRLEMCECYKKILEQFGGLDIVVNAAGVFNNLDFKQEILINLVGKINSMLEAQIVMGHGGVILNISGVHGGLKPFYSSPILAASFHGLVGLSRSWGHHRNFKRTGVRVVALCAGISNTNFFENLGDKTIDLIWKKELENALEKSKKQQADVCGTAALHVLKHGKSGSVWAVDGSNLYSLKIPKWETYRTLKSQIF